MMTLTEVTETFYKVCNDAGVEVTGFPVLINKRLRTTYGRVMFERIFHYNGEVTIAPTRVEFNPTFLETAERDLIISVIKHEAAHYIATKRTGEQHGHDAYFREICAEIGTVSDQHYCGEEAIKQETPQSKMPKYSVICCSCEKEIISYKRMCKGLLKAEEGKCPECGSPLIVVQNY